MYFYRCYPLILAELEVCDKNSTLSQGFHMSLGLHSRTKRVNYIPEHAVGSCCTLPMIELRDSACECVREWEND